MADAQTGAVELPMLCQRRGKRVGKSGFHIRKVSELHEITRKSAELLGRTPNIQG
jgi:hypothetical protein